MTNSPLTVAADVLLLDAREILREPGIRHLPVLEEKKLVGILSDRNRKEALASSGGERFLVQDAMMPDLFTVSPDNELSEVLEEMGEEKYGSALVQEKDGQVVGVFTTLDACRLLAELLADEDEDD